MLDKDEVKETIVNVARHIFSRFGFRKTTMDEIALATRKGKSSIYYYFESKEEIFQAVVEKEAGLLKAELHETISQIEDPREKLKAYILIRMRGLSKLANFYDALKNEYLSHLEFINVIRKKYDDDEIAAIENILKKGIENSEFMIDSPHLASVAIVTAMKGLEIPIFVEVSETDVEKRIDNLVNILFYGLVKR
ncbi:MAG TPA: TetR/AcrR family transcriptional regulator [Bacteroidales bacterium]|nr:TetR/AcrR family transcriptional regulator [Bacteroidales bacterium]